MIRPVYHPATGRRFDLASASAADIAFLRTLRDDLPSREHGLICETAGGSDEDKKMYAYRADDDTWWCRHFPGHGHIGAHRVEPESDAHKRGKEYALSAYDRGGIRGATEISSDNGTKSDVIGFGAVTSAAEIQASSKDARIIKARDTKARRAKAITTPGYARSLESGIQPVWTQIHDGAADWLHQVPSIRTTIRYGVWSERMPQPGTVGAAGVRTIDPEPCRPGSRWGNCPHLGSGFCGGWHAYATVRTGLTVDDVFVQAASGTLVPIRYSEYVYLTDLASVGLYTELGGNGIWIPGKPGSPRGTGPCRYRMHTAEDEQERVAREQAEHARIESQRVELERVEREQVLGDRYWNMYRLARLRREERERVERHSESPQPMRSPGEVVAVATQAGLNAAARYLPRGSCSCPGCGSEPARLYPCGWRCDAHKPRLGVAS